MTPLASAREIGTVIYEATRRGAGLRLVHQLYGLVKISGKSPGTLEIKDHYFARDEKKPEVRRRC
jgi:hypothetical protein